MAEFVTSSKRVLNKARPQLEAASEKAQDLFESTRQYAVRHPYQVILGAVGIAGLGALTAYLVNRKH